MHSFWFVFTEVIRTRLREEGSKYKYFFQTGRLIAVEEGYAAFYRGLIPQLIRQIPNTAIVLSTYELIVHLLRDSKWRNAWKLGMSWQMDATETQDTLGKRLLKMQHIHFFFMWCYRDFMEELKEVVLLSKELNTLLYWKLVICQNYSSSCGIFINTPNLWKKRSSS